jgi:hypothetical protein
MTLLVLSALFVRHIQENPKALPDPTNPKSHRLAAAIKRGGT